MSIWRRLHGHADFTAPEIAELAEWLNVPVAELLVQSEQVAA